MIILAGCEIDGAGISASLGASAYSYWFVLRAFRPVLERLGAVILVRDPAREVDAISRQFAARGEACVYLEFQPPNAVTLGLQTRTIPVFAWEFDTLPDEAWRGDERDDWRVALAATGHAVTHSAYAARVTRAAMGEEYPIDVIPAPVWDGFAGLWGQRADGGFASGCVRADTGKLDLTPWMPAQRPRERQPALLPPPAPAPLGGVVYTAVFNPIDARKNWADMLAAFIWALRDEAGATLVFKLTHADPDRFLPAMLMELAKHTPFRCRVVLLAGYLPDSSYADLVCASTYAVNASHGEGQCLPLMEFMSAGKPAVTPDHSAMADYVTPENSFIVQSGREPCGWPHDPRMVYRTTRRRIDFASLVAAFAESYRVAVSDPARYGRMAAAATAAMEAHCSRAVAEAGWRCALARPWPTPAPAPVRPAAAELVR